MSWGVEMAKFGTSLYLLPTYLPTLEAPNSQLFWCSKQKLDGTYNGGIILKRDEYAAANIPLSTRTPRCTYPVKIVRVSSYVVIFCSKSEVRQTFCSGATDPDEERQKIIKRSLEKLKEQSVSQ
jgi:hypothetical protein